MACVFAADEKPGVLREIRETPPAHYLFKVHNFSLLSENGVDKTKSDNFQAGGHQWKIMLFPKGNNSGKDNHVSIYLMLEGTSSLPAGKDVNAIFKFFLLDQIEGKYHTVQGSARRFDRVKYEWGFAKYISLEDLKNPTNGFLVNDSLFFGVEVFVSEGSCLGSCYSISEVANISGTYKWEINQFSELGNSCLSDEFVIGGYKWKLSLYPEGIRKHKGFSMSLFLESVNAQSSKIEHEVKAEYKLTLMDQFNKNPTQQTSTQWFGATYSAWGFNNFIKLKDLRDTKKGYIVEDRCIIEAEVTVLCETNQKTLNR